MIVVNVENVDDGVGAAHEVRVIGVYIGVLDLDQVPHHCVRRSEHLRQQVVHALDDFLSEVLEAGEFVHFDIHDDPSQLFVDHLHALQRWRLQPVDLLLGQDFEGDFGHEKIWPQGGSISDCCLDVVVGQGIEWVNVADCCRVVLVENVV